MPTTADIYYIDSDSFATATAVFTDAGLSTPAAAGYYQYDGLMRRQLAAGTLLPGVTCPSCIVQPAIGGTVATSINRVGVSERTSRISVISSDGTGVLRVVLDPNTSRAAGIYTNYEGSMLSAMYSSNFGYLAGPFYGNRSHQVSDVGLLTTPIDDWDGSSWVDSTSESKVFSGDDNSLQASPYGNLVMFIPKTDTNYSLLTIEIVSMFATPHDFQVDIYDVLELEELTVTAMQASANDACNEAQSDTAYVGRVASAIGVALSDGDVLFADANAASPLTAGFYGFDEGPNRYSVSVDQYGVISSKTLCQ
jgi:hypothetical protein